ncbi:rhodanese-like domain-containing protein [Neisseria dentiae]|uniref:rhodanese-like domain-containing protein n=2 Tax=Neisseria dentiae TaxID=194197 RepID=UPI0035A06E7C
MMIPQITPQQLQQWLAEGKPLTLLDVRTDEEVAFCALPGHVHIPMNLIPLRHNELPDEGPIVVYCHHGVRSLHTAMYLADAGFDELYNLQGGIDAWSLQADPTVPRY